MRIQTDNIIRVYQYIAKMLGKYFETDNVSKYKTVKKNNS